MTSCTDHTAEDALDDQREFKQSQKSTYLQTSPDGDVQPDDLAARSVQSQTQKNASIRSHYTSATSSAQEGLTPSPIQESPLGSLGRLWIISKYILP